jgi:transcriptional regulator with XRE-family HTH domain
MLRLHCLRNADEQGLDLDQRIPLRPQKYMHRTYYSAIERGEQNVTLDTLETVGKGLGVRMWEVMKDAGD